MELVSVDSMAVYRGMDIGTAKPTPDVQAEVPYHLVDLVDPDEEYTVTRFQADARTALAGIADRGACAVLVGGTGLYLRSVIDDLSFPGRYPEVAAELTAELDALGPAGSAARRDGCGRLHARLGESTPRRRRASNRATSVAWSGPSRSPSARDARSPRSGPGSSATRRAGSRWSASGVDAEDVDRRIAERFARLMDARLPRRGPGAVGPPGRAVAHGPSGPGLPRAARPRRGRVAAERCRRRSGAAHPRLRPPPTGLVPPGPPDRVGRPGRRPGGRGRRGSPPTGRAPRRTVRRPSRTTGSHR